jgi:hypothetical protein
MTIVPAFERQRRSVRWHPLVPLGDCAFRYAETACRVRNRTVGGALAGCEGRITYLRFPCAGHGLLFSNPGDVEVSDDGYRG